jgi:hypothetical protein
MGLAVLTGGLAFVGTANATELIVDGSFENTKNSSLAVVRVGGLANPNVGQGWSYYSTYLYSTQYTLPGPTGSGEGFLRPYASGVYGVTQSSATVHQEVSLTAATTLTPAKIDAGNGRFTATAWFSSYLTQGDFSDLTVEFRDANQQAVGDPVALGGEAFINNIPTAANSRYGNAKDWAQDRQTGTIPAGARFAYVTIQSTSRGGAPDGYVDLVSLDVQDNSLNVPTVSIASPGDNTVGVNPPVDIRVTIEDRLTAVQASSVKLFLDGALVPAMVNKADTNTFVSFSAGVLPALSSHSYSVVFADTATPTTVQTNTYHFTLANYLTLPSQIASPLGSEQTNLPGFLTKVYQVASLGLDPKTATSDLPHSISFDETVLAGLVATNIADLSTAASGNVFPVTTVIDWVNSTGTAPNFPSTTGFPGIPGTSGVEDNFVHEITTYIRFQTAGFYKMGVNNNNAFKLTAAHAGVQRLQITAPTNQTIPAVAIATNISQLQFGGALPAIPLTGTVVYATPSGNPEDGCTLASATNLSGKIALIDIGDSSCDSSVKAEQAQLAGAIAVIETVSADAGFPSRIGSINTNVRIPVLVISDGFGGAALKSLLAGGKPVTASIQGEPAPVISEWDGPRAFGNVDVFAGFAVPAPGLYPFRLVADHSTGNANLEWYSILPDGTKVLINDTSSPDALRTYQAVVVTPKLATPILANGTVTLAWTGTGVLQESTSVKGPFAPSANQANPQTVTPSGALRYYRVVQP